MPNPGGQERVLGAVVAGLRVRRMELYNTARRAGELTYAAVPAALWEMRMMFPICFVMGFCLIDRLAPKIAARMARPGVDPPVLVTTVRACVTVAFMCPIMSAWAVLIFQRPGLNFLPAWLQTAACNFPMAFFWQVFFCGPLVRFLFRRLFPSARTV